MWKLVLMWAVQAQLLDVREARYYEPDSWNIIVARAVDLRSAPRIEDDHFPPTEWVQARRDFHWQTEMYCESGAREHLHRYEGFKEVQALAQRNRVICEAILDARKGFFYVTVKRHALALAKERLGAEAFNDGELP